MGRLITSIAAGVTGIATGYFYNHKTILSGFINDAVTVSSIEVDDKSDNNISKFGLPHLAPVERKNGYILVYDTEKKIAKYVAEFMTSYKLGKKTGFKTYFPDEKVPEICRITKDDYANSGFQKAHFAAAGNYDGDQRKATFNMTNMSPQFPSLNQGAWQQLEDHIRNDVKGNQNEQESAKNKKGSKIQKNYISANICSGPLYIPKEVEAEQYYKIFDEAEYPGAHKRIKVPKSDGKFSFVMYRVIGEKNVAVPTHCFKVIVFETQDNQYVMESYIMPNEKLNKHTALDQYMVPRTEIEKKAGFQIYDKLKDEDFFMINGKEMNWKATISQSRSDDRGSPA